MLCQRWARSDVLLGILSYDHRPGTGEKQQVLRSKGQNLVPTDLYFLFIGFDFPISSSEPYV